jgi:nucleotidyltransferase/DNA polymerase involved in DNA repair
MLVACILAEHLPHRVEIARRAIPRRKPAIIYHDDLPFFRVVDATPGHCIHAGMPLATAQERCPDAILIPADNTLYRQLWDAVIHRWNNLGLAVEDAGTGCAYTTVPDSTGGFGDDANMVATVMRAVPYDWLPRVGVAAGKFPAWCAADGARPGHAVRMPHDDARRCAFLAPFSVNHLPLDTRVLATLHDAGIHTLGQLAGGGPSALQNALGAQWRLARDLARGIDRRPVNPPVITGQIAEGQTTGVAFR